MRVGAMAYTQNVTQETTTNWPSVTKKKKKQFILIALFGAIPQAKSAEASLAQR